VSPSFDLSLYRQALLFLVIAGVVAPLFVRIRVSPILGFLLAGVALGPYGLGSLQAEAPWLAAFALSDMHTIDRLAEFGVVALLFTIGLELSFERLTLMRRLIFGLGLSQVVVSTALIACVAILLGEHLKSALLIGASLALSSTAIVVPLFAERKRLSSPAGRASFAVLLLQDLAVAPILVMVALLGESGETSGVGPLLALAPAALGLAALILFGRLLLRPLMHLVASSQSPELFMAACLLVALGAAISTAAAGLSMSLGAFVAGLLLAETEYRRAIEVMIEPFKGLLLGLFFVSVGAGLDLGLVRTAPLAILGAALGLIALKGAATFSLARAFGLANPVARDVAVHIAPGGEFAFVALAAGVGNSVIESESAGRLNVAVAITMAILPVISALTARLAPPPRGPALDAEATNPPSGDEAARVIIVGYGRVGSLIGDMLNVHKIPFIAVDSDPSVVRRERAAGHPIYYGDASNVEFLKRCGVEIARAVVVTTHIPSAAEEVVKVARALRKDLPIIARARDAAHAEKLYEFGVSDAVPETVEASLQLSEAALVGLGVPAGPVIASIHEKRDEIRHALQLAAQEAGREKTHAIRAKTTKRLRR